LNDVAFPVTGREIIAGQACVRVRSPSGAAASYRIFLWPERTILASRTTKQKVSAPDCTERVS